MVTIWRCPSGAGADGVLGVSRLRADVAGGGDEEEPAPGVGLQSGGGKRRAGRKHVQTLHLATGMLCTVLLSVSLFPLTNISGYDDFFPAST